MHTNEALFLKIQGTFSKKGKRDLTPHPPLASCTPYLSHDSKYNMPNIFRVFHILANHLKSSKTYEVTVILRKKCPYSEFFWSVFSPNAGKYGAE